MSEPTSEPVLVEVRILGLPVEIYREASEHHDGLRRELTLILRGTPDTGALTVRLTPLVEKLEARFHFFTAEPTGALRRALAGGVEEVDLVYWVPAGERDAVLELEAALDEADEFCRHSDLLLTPATLPRPLAFRRWFLGEFVAQIDGAPPTPWTQAAADHRASLA